MTLFDIAVLSVIGVSVALGLWRGVVGELLAIGAWVIGFLIARAAAADLAPLLAGWIKEPPLQLVVTYILILVATLIVVAIARRLIAMLVGAAGLGFTDHMLGAVFGVMRGGLVVLIAVMLAGMTALPAAEWWRAATLAPPLETAVIAVKPWLPQDVSRRIRYR